MPEVINAVVIDNEIRDIVGVTTALAEIGISTLPVYYTDPTMALESCSKASSASPRVIITDIQLRDGGREPTKSDLSQVAACIKKIVENTSGHYVVLAWTSKPDSLDALRERVESYFQSEGIRVPLYFDRICKNECRDGNGGYIVGKILERFLAHLTAQASVRALLHWECSVLQAAVESVNKLSELDAGSLPQSLKSLAISVAGSNLHGFEATAINEAFSYVLRDRLGLLSIGEETQEIWANALSQATGEVPEASKHQLNTILHVESEPQSQIICPGDVWLCTKKPKLLFQKVEVGSESNNQVERMKGEFLSLTDAGRELDTQVRNQTDAALKKGLQEQFKEKCGDPLKVAMQASTVALIEISPACDFANQKKPLKTIALGVLIPRAQVTNEIAIKESASNIVVKIMHEGAEHYLGFSAKYITALSEKLIGLDELNLEKALRIRESLLQSWIHKFAAYNSRIGTISL